MVVGLSSTDTLLRMAIWYQKNVLPTRPKQRETLVAIIQNVNQ
jgi:hypothetical protein